MISIYYYCFEFCISGVKNDFLYLYVSDLVQLKKEMEEKKSKMDSITKALQKKESEFSKFKNENEKLILKIKEIESEKKSLEEKATGNESENI